VLVSGAHTVLTNIFQVFGVFVTTALLARRLGPAGKGVYDVYLSASMLLSSLLGFSLNSGISYSVSSTRVNVGKVLRAIWGIVIAVALLGGCVCFAFQYLPSSRLLIPVELGKLGILLVVVSVASLTLAALWRAVVVGQRHFLQANFGDIAKQVAMVIALVVLLRLVARTHLVIWAIGCNIIAICTAAAMYRRAVDWHEDDPTAGAGMRRAARFSVPSHLANISQFLNARMDVFFVYHFWGASSVGLYQVGVMVAQAVNMIPQATQAVLFPTISARPSAHEESALMIARANRMLLAFGFVGGLFIAAIAPFAIPLVLGPKFRPSTLALLLLLPGCVTLIATNVTAAYFAGIGRPDLNFRSSMFGLFATVVLDIALIPHWNFYGASIASSVSYAVTTIVQVVLFKRETALSLRAILVPTLKDLSDAKQLVSVFAARFRAA
jgi:O-antigen/teichoic acid export membrane protein